MRFSIWAAICVGLVAGATGALADGYEFLDACVRKGEQGKNEEAVDLCTRAINAGDLSDRNLVVTYINRSISYRGLRQFDKALADCNKALSLRADDFDAHMACGNAYGGKGDYASGIRHYDQAISLEPEDAIAHNNRGNQLNQAGDYKQALPAFENALRLNPDYVLAHLNRGVALFSLGQFPEAVKALEQAVESGSDDAYALLWLTLARRRAGIAVTPEDLMKAAEDIDHKAWPWPLVAYFAGDKIDFAEAVRFGNVETGTSGASDQDCEASFYYGEMAIILGQTAEAKQRLQHAADTCVKTFVEHAGALAELARL